MAEKLIVYTDGMSVTDALPLVRSAIRYKQGAYYPVVTTFRERQLMMAGHMHEREINVHLDKTKAGTITARVIAHDWYVAVLDE